MNTEPIFNGLCRLTTPMQCIVCGESAFVAVVILTHHEQRAEMSITPLCGDCAMRAGREHHAAKVEAHVEESTRRQEGN